MIWRVLKLSLIVGAMLALPIAAYAQNPSISGTVTDATGGVLPGVTVRAVHEATGNNFETVTDGAGAWRLLVRIGAYRIMAELAGFAPLNRTGLELVVGQQAVVNLQMVPATLQESVTVTGETPLVDVSSSTVSGVIDQRQMQDVPLNGRNWMDLAMLAPGSRQTAADQGAPLMRQGYSQINMDGQQVTTNFIGLGNDQPKFSVDAIAEFELVTNRFDATQGRSVGMQVNAVTKSGSNTFSGTVGSYFRDDKLNAADKVSNKVLPYSNQQLSTTFGGPIRRDRVHFFGNYEAEREPSTLVYDNAEYPLFNMDLPVVRRQHTGGVKVDAQFTPQLRLSSRFSHYIQRWVAGGGANHPSGAQNELRYTDQFQNSLTKVLGTSAVNELKFGVSLYTRINEPLIRFAGGNFPNADTYSLRTGTGLNITMTGYSGGTGNVQWHNQNKYSVRDDFSLFFTKGGRHSIKLGGEYIYDMSILRGCGSTCRPTLLAQNGRVPAAVMYKVFPVWNDASTFNLDLLAPYAERYTLGLSPADLKGFYREIPQNLFAGWFQDDWTITPRLTVNLGVRWDLETGIGAKLALPPLLPGDNPEDTNNVGPRAGFAFTVNERTVIRGGYGLYFAEGTADEYHQTQLHIFGVAPLILNSPFRADFVTNPYNGPRPTVEQTRANACDLNGSKPGCVKREFVPEMVDPFFTTPYSHQMSMGIQRQLGTRMAFESNFSYTGGRNEEDSRNVNLNYNPVTGVNYDYRVPATLPMPDFGRIQLTSFQGWSNYYGWENSFTKRMSNRWQAQLTYTMAQFKDATAEPYAHAIVDGRLVRTPLGFKTAPDIGSDYTLASGDQRHRAVFNGIFDAGWGVQLSGLYFYGSGERMDQNTGVDRRFEGVSSGTRLRANGEIIPRNNFIGLPIHRVDMRLQKSFQLGGSRSLSGILEVFNLFNRANYGSYTTNETSANFGKPLASTNKAYASRGGQIGMRFAF